MWKPYLYRGRESRNLTIVPLHQLFSLPEEVGHDETGTCDVAGQLVALILSNQPHHTNCQLPKESSSL